MLRLKFLPLMLEVVVYAKGGSPSVRCGSPDVSRVSVPAVKDEAEDWWRKRRVQRGKQRVLIIGRQGNLGYPADGRPAFELGIDDNFC